MSINWDKFDKEFNTKALAEELKEAEANGSTNDFKEVPHGTYEVKIHKMELTTSKSSGSPMFTCWFKVLAGEYKDCMIFMNQVVTQRFQISIVDEFLRSLDSGLEVEFESYKQWDQLIMDIFEAIDGKLEYLLVYGKTRKGFNTFEIEDVFEVE